MAARDHDEGENRGQPAVSMQKGDGNRLVLPRSGEDEIELGRPHRVRPFAPAFASASAFASAFCSLRERVAAEEKQAEEKQAEEKQAVEKQAVEKQAVEKAPTDARPRPRRRPR